MIVLAGADVVLPDRVLGPASVVVDEGRIVDVVPGAGLAARGPGSEGLSLDGCVVLPGFVDVHVHGLGGHDVSRSPERVPAIARMMPAFGVTAFCPTAVACGPATLRTILETVRVARQTAPRGARVLPAHLESGFVNADYRGAQPAACLRLPPAFPSDPGRVVRHPSDDEFDGEAILREVERGATDLGVVTLAPELPGALRLVRWLVERGIRVSVGHTGASFDTTLEAIDAGASRATHLFNCMPPLHHRAPGAVGALLQSEHVAVEIICDGHHLHPATVRAVVERVGTTRTMAVTDGTAASGLAPGARARLGPHSITAGPDVARLDDGTVAGSVATMDTVFRVLVETVGLSLVEAAHLCATTPAARLDRPDLGAIEPGRRADLVVLDRRLRVRHTLVAGEPVFGGTGTGPDPSI